jgi:hypothetical protein
VRQTRARPDRARIADLADSTSLDSETGAVRSVQRADLVVERETLGQIWTPTYLERLARTYWRFLSRVTLGLVRVRYGEDERALVLLVPALALLSFQAPEYELGADRGVVRWRISRGLLVARRGRERGYLQIEARRRPASAPGTPNLHVEVEVASFYPAIASGLGARLYEATQSRIHVAITYGFLRSLARLDLAVSRVGRLEPDTTDQA